ncbi:protein kinase [Actinoplanes sp. NPDC049596]|uniref:serine/threonine-protein kinase n=1 Tax=unclassified Actinoplanes TaxID=2626549 RepID=UPI0034318E9B
MSEDWPIAGTLLASRYRLAELLEIGGMSQIWRADDELLARPVAVKLPLGAQVVWREARMAAKLQHPNIAAVHDYREAVRPDGSVTPFVVMELLAGESVAARLEREPIGLAEAARIGAAVADALAAAHASGVVHRDIKPGNVMLTPTGVKILDFGISATAGEPDDDESGSTFGTPAYVAPERLDGMPSEPATDVYGLGVLLFEMVTGDPPYPVDTWEELAEARANGGPRQLPADLPPAFRELVGRCLDESPAERPAADEVRFDLTALWLKPAPAFFGPAPASAPLAALSPDPSPARATTASSASSSRAGASSSRAGASSPRAGASSPRAGASDYTPGRAVPASGRAPATTLALTKPPARRLALALGVTALVVALGGLFAIVNWPSSEPAIDANPELPAPPVVTSTLASPLATIEPTTPPPTSSSPTPKPSPTISFDDAVSRFRSAVERGAAGGDIRSDVATDLLNLLQPLTRSGGDTGNQVDQLRRKINDRAGEGSVSSAQAAVLRSRLADLDKAARTM